MKKIVCLLLIGVICMGLGGCGSNKTNDIYANIDFPTEVMGYLNELYDDEFAFGNNDYGNSDMAKFWATDFQMKSKKYDGQEFTVRLDVDGFNKDEERATNVKKHFYDDYFRLQWNDDANQFFSNILEECGIDAVMRVTFVGYSRPEGLAPDATFEDYLRQGKVYNALYVFSNEKIPHEIQMAFANKIVALEEVYGFFGRYLYNIREDGTSSGNKRPVVTIRFCLTDLSVIDMQKRTWDDLNRDNKISAKPYQIYSDLRIEEFEEERSY